MSSTGAYQASIPLITEGIPPSQRASPHLRGCLLSSWWASPISEVSPLILEGMVKKTLAAPSTHLAPTNTNALQASPYPPMEIKQGPSNPVTSPSSEQTGSFPCSPQFPQPLLIQVSLVIEKEEFEFHEKR